MLKKKILYSLNDISIIPSSISFITSRKDCYPYEKKIDCSEYRDNFPLITAPMTCIDIPKEEFTKQRINYIIPRTKYDFSKRLELCREYFCAFSLAEASEFLELPETTYKRHVLIDIANGHMSEQINIGKKLKQKLGDRIVLMGGNIANPKTYIEYDKAGFDYLRIGIGTGDSCLTATQTGIMYPMASLLDEIRKIRKWRFWSKCKIIADGGMSCYSDIIKSLALGADYVMCGKLFAKACLDKEDIDKDFQYYGMSTKKAQAEMGKTKLKTSEGREITLKKEYTLSGWVENFNDYLRSSMSYCNSSNLKEYKKNSICQVISPNSSYKINNK